MGIQESLRERLGNNTAVHVRWDGIAEEVKDRRCNVDNSTRLQTAWAHPPTGQTDHPLHPMMTVEHRRRLHQRRAGELMAAETDIRLVQRGEDDVRGAIGEWPLIRRFASLGGLDNRLARVRITPVSKSCSDLAAQRLILLTRGYASLRLPALQIDIDAGEVPAQRIPPGTRPIYIRPREESALHQSRAGRARHLALDPVRCPISQAHSQPGCHFESPCRGQTQPEGQPFKASEK